MNLKKSFWLFFIFLFALSCSQNDSPINAGGLQISVSVLPEKYFVERIGGDLVTVNVMVGPGDSPHTYEPKVDQMKAISSADIYFAIGVEFEDAWMDRIASANPDMKIVNLDADVDKILFEAGEEDVDDHAGELDPHIWTSPALAIKIARKIHQEFTRLDPVNEPIYTGNLQEFLADIETLQVEIKNALNGMASRKFMVFHPSWGYFAREFNLEQIAVEVGGTEPSPAELIDLIEQARKEGIRVIFAQPEFSTQSADYIASEIGGEVILTSPLAEDWLTNLRAVTEKLKLALNQDWKRN